MTARTLRSVLDTDYAETIVEIVGDDGSKAGTAAGVARVAGGDPRERLLRQVNA